MADLPIGEAVKVIRIHRCISQHELARRAGLAENYISRIEMGRNVPRLDTLDLISQALDIELYKVIRHATRMRDALELPPLAAQETAHGR